MVTVNQRKQGYNVYNEHVHCFKLTKLCHVSVVEVEQVGATATIQVPCVLHHSQK